MFARTALLGSLLLGTLSPALAQSIPKDLISAYNWRQIGPFRGGRSCAVSGVVGRPNEFYMGATGGGVWKSTDAGENWTCVSDGFFATGSVGAIEVSRSNPDVVVVGMGETEIRGNISHGDGVYKSTNAGKTWTHIGLKDTETISRVRIHPTDPNTIWVAALGHIYGPHRDRGIFKTTDGGKTWVKTLFVDEQSGAVDLVLDPSNPKRLYASTWTAFRTPYSLNSGGPGSKLWMSNDGGETWKDISPNLKLDGPLGKIGVTVSPANPKRLYAVVENKDGGLFTSADAGETWQKVNGSREIRQRAWYYTRVYADPKDENTVTVLNVMMHKSTDGGKTLGRKVAMHSDHHDLWIDPNDPKRMISGNDGGATVSIDGGNKWTELDIPTAQFYHVTTDNAFPYRILGAQQDNSTVRIASRTFGAGITDKDWESTAGGESGYIAAKPNDPDIVIGGSYGGDLELKNHRTGLSRAINPWPDNPMGAGAADLVQRFQWTFPIHFSHHDPNRLFVTSQYVLQSDDLGTSFKRISPDLTRNDKSRQASSGGPITQDNTSVEYYGTVFSLAESPLRKGLMWAGSDDGLIHVTQDGGETWANVTPRRMPNWGLVSSLEASRVNPGVAYAAVDNHENDDKSAYIFRTEDYGRTWSRIDSGLPMYVRVVREMPGNPKVLFAGTETGIWISFDTGKTWKSLQNNLPVVPIHDLVIKNNDLIVATHGRSFWVLDNISSLVQLENKDFTRTVLFAPRESFNVEGGFNAPIKPGTPIGKNPEGEGIALEVYSPIEQKEVSLKLFDKQNVAIEDKKVNLKVGLNRLYITPDYPSYKGFSGMRMWGGSLGPIPAPPGMYRVELSTKEYKLTANARWSKDPRLTVSDRDLEEQFKLSMEIARATDAANRAVEKCRELRKALGENKSADAAKHVAALTEIEEAIYQTKAESSQDFLNFPIRLNNKLAALLDVVKSANGKPTRQSYEVFRMLNAQLKVQLDKLAEVQKSIPATKPAQP